VYIPAAMALADRPLWGWAVTLGSAALVVSPALAREPKDSFPLSNYPMFSHGRKDATVTVDHAVALGADGSEQPVPPRLVGSDEVLQARATIGRAARRGAGEARALCSAIAGRVRAAGALEGAERIEIRTTKLDAVAWFVAAGEDAPPPAPLSVKRHATCPVER
jgi:hypothetical protein